MSQKYLIRIAELESQLHQKDQQLSLVEETEAFLRSALARAEEKIEEDAREIEHLRAQIEKLRRMLFGSQPSNTQTITFVADKATATVSGIEVMGNYALADGKAKQTYKVTVTDANNNLVKDSEVTLTASPASLNLEPNGTATTNEQGQAIFTATTTVAATYTLKAQVSQTNGQVSTKTAESKFVADDKNAVLTASSDMQSLVADGKSTAKLEVTLMSANNPVGGNMWVDIQTPEGVTEKDYQFLPSKNDHFVSGKITRKFSTSKPGVYTFTFNALTYGGYEMKPVTVTITAVDADTAKDEEAMK
ncbi:Ig-like domain-containing protein [Escherichia coli]